MKRNSRFYKIIVDDQGQRASHIAVSYNHRPSDEVTFFEFFRVAYDTSLGASVHSIPPGDLSFREELRVMDFSIHAENVHSNNYEQVLRNKMSEAYGENVDVTIEEIQINI